MSSACFDVQNFRYAEIAFRLTSSQPLSAVSDALLCVAFKTLREALPLSAFNIASTHTPERQTAIRDCAAAIAACETAPQGLRETCVAQLSHYARSPREAVLPLFVVVDAAIVMFQAQHPRAHLAAVADAVRSLGDDVGALTDDLESIAAKGEHR